MPQDESTPQQFGDDTPWQALYEQAADVQNDFLSDLRSAVDYGLADPEDTIQVTCAAAENADAAVKALSHEWALYTPQDAAIAASALLVQLQQNADALAALRRAIGRMAHRNEVVLPKAAGPGQVENLSDALNRLLALAGEIHGLVDRNASTVVRALHAAEGTAVLPQDAHETLVAVADLLSAQHDGQVTLNRRHEDGEYDPSGDGGFGCSCDVTIVSRGEKYSFHRGDSEWCLVRLSDGVKGDDGYTSYSNWDSLSTSLDTAHPQQLTNDILQAVKD